MLTNKGFDWASAYWGANVDKQILNSISYGSSYGKRMAKLADNCIK